MATRPNDPSDVFYRAVMLRYLNEQILINNGYSDARTHEMEDEELFIRVSIIEHMAEQAEFKQKLQMAQLQQARSAV